MTLLPRGEAYVMTMPYAHCKGILVGTLSMELGGTVSIVCEKTGYFCELDFKLKVISNKRNIVNLPDIELIKHIASKFIRDSLAALTLQMQLVVN